MDSLVMERAPRATDNRTDDYLWLPAARQGESWALEALYNAYQPAIYGLCWRILGCAEDAEDAMQASFIQAFGALPRFRGDCAVKTWLYRIAVNHAISLLRKRKAGPTELLYDPPATDELGVTDRLAVRAALSRLRRDHYVVIVLRYWEQLSYEDIASLLELPLSTVKMRIKRAKEAFRQAYEGMI